MKTLQFAVISVAIAITSAGLTAPAVAGEPEASNLSPEDQAIMQEFAGILVSMRDVIASLSGHFAKSESATPQQPQGKAPETPPGQSKKQENSSNSATPTPQPSPQAATPGTPPASTSSNQGEKGKTSGETPGATTPTATETNEESRSEADRADAQLRNLEREINAVNERIAKRPPHIAALDPASGPLGTSITVKGSGFALEENKIFIRGNIVVEHLSSPDGATIVFTLPRDLPCGIGEACPIKVITPTGISNAVPFKITAGVPAPPPEPTATSTPPLPGGDGAVTVLAPNGGEVWYKDGQSREIRWSSVQVPPNWTATVTLVRQNVGTTVDLFTDIANDGSEFWNIPTFLTEGRDYVVTIRICNTSKQKCHTDTSDNPFGIFTPPPKIIPATLPDGKVGQPYSPYNYADIGARGGLPPLEWSIAGGALPSGLTLTTELSAGNISGTPAAAGTFRFTAKVTDAQGLSDTEEFSITIAGPCATDAPRPPTYITYDTCSEQEPAVTRRANGDLVSVFNSGGNNLALLRGAVSRDQGTTWTTPLYAVQSWDDMALTEGPDGTLVLLAWASGGESGLVTYTSTDGITWANKRKVTPAQINNSVGDILYARDGYFYASYHASVTSTTTSDTLITRSRDLVAWEAPVNATNGVDRSNDSSLLQTADGTFWLAYNDVRNPTGVVIMSSPDGRVWSRVTFIPGLGPNHGAVNLAEIGGKPVVFGRMGYSTYYSYPRGDGSWSAPMKILDNTPFGAEAVVLGDGAIGLVYTYIADLATNPYGQRDIRFANVGKISLASPITITTEGLPAATVQMRYLAELKASGGLTPYTWRITSGLLPKGIVLGSTTGILSGLLQFAAGPTDWGLVAYRGIKPLTIDVADAAGSHATRTLNFEVRGIVDEETNSTEININKGLEKNYAYGARVVQMNIGDSIFYLSPNASYDFGNDTGKAWYYNKYGTSAQPNHLSMSLYDFDSTFAPNERLDKALDIKVVIDAGEKMVYFPAVAPGCTTHTWDFYVAKDGSTYFSRRDHRCGYPDLSPEEALTPQHLARGASATPDLSAQPSSPTDFSPNSMRAITILGAEIVKITPATATLAPITPSLAITTVSLPNGTVGVPYVASTTATGGTPPYAWAVASGNFPAGLALNAATGIISGTPTAAGTATSTLKVTDSAGTSATKQLSIEIKAATTAACPVLPDFQLVGALEPSWSTTNVTGYLNVGGGVVSGLLKLKNGTILAAENNVAYVPEWGATTTVPKVFRSSDNGRTWNGTVLPFLDARLIAVTIVDGHKIHKVVEDSNGILYSAGTRIWKSTDGGVSWTVLIPPMPLMTSAFSPYIMSLALAPDGALIASVNKQGLPDPIAEFYRSADGGQSWQLVTTHNNSIGSAMVVANDNGLIFVDGYGSSLGVYRFANGTKTQTLTSKSFGGGMRVMKARDGTLYLVAYNPNNTYMSSSGGSPDDPLVVYRSGDHGQTWIPAGYPLKAYQTGALIEASDGSLAFASYTTCSSTNFYRSFDRGSTWTALADRPDYLKPMGTDPYHIHALLEVGGVFLNAGNTVAIFADTMPSLPSPPPPPAPLTITTGALSGGTVGISYSATLSATGGILPYDWSIAQGVLPAGLSLAPATGAISGTPTTAGAATFTVQVRDSTASSTTKAFSISVQSPPPAAPTNIRAGWGITRDNTNQSSLYFHAINFTVAEPYPSALRVYLKKPGESTFSRAAEFTAAQFAEASPCSKIVTSGSTSYTSWWTMFRFCNSNGWKIDSYLRPASGYPEGEYQFYLASVDSAGNESVTPKFGMYNLAPLTILSPTSSQSPVAAKPTFQWTVSRGWPTSPAPYTIYIYDQANFAMSKEVHVARVDVFTASTTGTYVYDGPALDPAKKYRVLATGLMRAAVTTICPSCDYISMDVAAQTFWVSTTGAPSSTLTCPTTPDFQWVGSFESGWDPATWSLTNTSASVASFIKTNRGVLIAGGSKSLKDSSGTVISVLPMVYRSLDNGKTWNGVALPSTATDPKYTTIAVRTLAEDQNGILYAGGTRSTLWKSTDGGITWTTLPKPTSSLGSWPSSPDLVTVNNLLVRRDNTLVATLGTAIYTSPAEIHQSSDGGNSWQKVLTHTRWIVSIVEAGDGALVLMDSEDATSSTSGYRGVYRWFNGTLTKTFSAYLYYSYNGFEKTLAQTRDGILFTVMKIPEDPYLTGTIASGSTHLVSYSSSDNGITWVRGGTLPVSSQNGRVLGDAADGSMYAITYTSCQGDGLYRSADRGTTWTLLTDGPSSYLWGGFVNELQPLAELSGSVLAVARGGIFSNGPVPATASAPTSSPTVSLASDRTSVEAGKPFTLTVNGHSDAGLAAVWWFGTSTGVTDANVVSSYPATPTSSAWFTTPVTNPTTLDRTFGSPLFTSTQAVKDYTFSSTVTIAKAGTYILGANSRDVLYPVAGEPHQASEGTGMASVTVTVVETTPPPAALPTAPTSIEAQWGVGGTGMPPAWTYSHKIKFSYATSSLSDIQSFRLYQKQPGATSFALAATFANPASIGASCSGFVRSDPWNLYYYCPPVANPPYWIAELVNGQSTSYFPIGEYDFYLAAVNAAGVEGPPSLIAAQYAVERTTILSPIGLQSTTTPTFRWTVASGWPSQSATYAIRVANSKGIVYTPNIDITAISEASKVYDGPPLDPSFTYSAAIFGSTVSNGRYYISMNEAPSTFQVPAPAPTPPPPSAISTVTVTAPNGGETWMQQTKPLIKWNASNITGNTVTINLLKGGAFSRAIAALAAQSAASGSFSYVWTIPTDIPQGSDYQMEIVNAADPNVRDRSDGMFTIIPMPETITIRGRIMDIKTGQPVANTTVKSFSTNGTTITTGADGAFTVSAATAPVTATTSQSWYTSRTCYLTLGNGFSVIRPPLTGYYTNLGPQPENSLWVSANPFDAVRAEKYFAVLGPEVNIGDFVVWPVSDFFYFHSDVPLKYMVEYPEEGRGAGISYLTTSGGSSGLIPLDYNVRARLTDANNQSFYSSYGNFPLSQGCNPVALKYQGGQSSWEPVTLRLTAPNGGESWQAGTTQSITWNASGLPFGSLVNIQLRDGLAPSTVIATLSTTTPAASGGASWPIPPTLRAGSYRIQIQPTSGSGTLYYNHQQLLTDLSDAPFNVTAP